MATLGCSSVAVGPYDIRAASEYYKMRMIGGWLAAQGEAANKTAASGLNGEVTARCPALPRTSPRQESDEMKVVGDADLDQFVVAHAMNEVGCSEAAA